MTKDQNSFTQTTRRTLAKRARQICSNPHCEKPTSGPHSDSNKTVDVGEAAHIKGAKPGSKRYDPNMTPVERRDINNGIWLCRTCAKLIDSDENKYTVELLHEWKKKHEAEILKELESRKQTNQTESQGTLQISPRIHTGKELAGLFRNVHLRSLNSSELTSEEEAELVGNFFRYLEDLHDLLGMGVSAGDIIETEFELNSYIEELEENKLYVYGKHLVQDNLVAAVIHVVRQKMPPDQAEVEWDKVLQELTNKGVNQKAR